MSGTRGASSYLSSQLRGHSAFVSSRKLVELGNKRRKPWRKRWYADTTNFFLDGQHLFSCQDATLGVTTESGPGLLKELIARRSNRSLCWCARWVGWTHAKHRTFLVRRSTGFNILESDGKSRLVFLNGVIARRSYRSLCWCTLWAGWTTQSFLVRKLNRVGWPEQNIARIRSVRPDTSTGSGQSPQGTMLVDQIKTGSSSKINRDGWIAHEVTTWAPPPTPICQLDSTRKMGSIDRVERIEQAAKRIAVSIYRDGVDRGMHPGNETLHYWEDFYPLWMIGKFAS